MAFPPCESGYNHSNDQQLCLHKSPSGMRFSQAPNKTGNFPKSYNRSVGNSMIKIGKPAIRLRIGLREYHYAIAVKIMMDHVPM